ncbi:hypothetical protein FKB34_04085 [Glycocaulis profundi]|nr:hypothetical protein FKB34_04085 [Glycocaulis profundi]
MSNQAITAYLEDLARSLADMDRYEARDILTETESHLHARAGQGRLDETLSDMGTPQAYAARFRGEPGAASPARLPVLAASGVLVLLAFFMAGVAVIDFLVPSFGLWTNSQTGSVVLGLASPSPTSAAREVWSDWLAMASLGVCLVFAGLGGVLARNAFASGDAGSPA